MRFGAEPRRKGCVPAARYIRAGTFGAVDALIFNSVGALLVKIFSSPLRTVAAPRFPAGI